MSDRYRTIAENFLANPRPVAVLAEELEVSTSTIYRALRAHDIDPSEHQGRIDLFVAMSLAARAASLYRMHPIDVIAKIIGKPEAVAKAAIYFAIQQGLMISTFQKTNDQSD